MTKLTPTEWKANNHRPHWVRDNRERIAEATGVDVPSRLGDIDEWIDDYKGVVTRRLRDQDDTDE